MYFVSSSNILFIFRTTAAANLGKYHLIRDFYTNLNSNGIDLAAYNATNVTLEDLYNFTSHRKENMFVRYVIMASLKLHMSLTNKRNQNPSTNIFEIWVNSVFA